MRTPDGQTRLVLASGSPRRRELLQGLGFRFDVAAADLDETPRPGEAAEPYVRRLAEEKARAVARHHPGAWVLAADTTVALGERLLGKPRDPGEAREMLRALSGRTHRVLTGVALAGAREGACVVATEVTFRALSEGELGWYADTGEPLDKAGGYALQGKGSFLVERVDGSPTNVIGLPLGETLALLARAGFPLPWEAGR